MNSLRFSFAFASVMNMWGVHTPQQQATITRKKQIPRDFFSLSLSQSSREKILNPEIFAVCFSLFLKGWYQSQVTQIAIAREIAEPKSQSFSSILLDHKQKSTIQFGIPQLVIRIHCQVPNGSIGKFQTEWQQPGLRVASDLPVALRDLIRQPLSQPNLAIKVNSGNLCS